MLFCGDAESRLPLVQGYMFAWFVTVAASRGSMFGMGTGACWDSVNDIGSRFISPIFQAQLAVRKHEPASSLLVSAGVGGLPRALPEAGRPADFLDASWMHIVEILDVSCSSISITQVLQLVLESVSRRGR